MSFRLVVDTTDLGRTADQLEQAVDVARRVDGDAGRMAGTVRSCGHGGLAGAAEHFLEAWGYGMRVVATDADGLADVLRGAAEAYLAVDDAGAAGLRELR